MSLTRTITVMTEMVCCRNGDDAYHPLPKPIRAETTEDDFTTSLTIWRDRAETILYDKYKTMAEDECNGMGTLRLCIFELRVISVNEIGQPSTPTNITEQIEVIEQKMEDTESAEEYEALLNELNKIKESYKLE